MKSITKDESVQPEQPGLASELSQAKLELRHLITEHRAALDATEKLRYIVAKLPHNEGTAAELASADEHAASLYAQIQPRQAEIERLQGEIDTERHAAFLTASRGSRQKIRTLLIELSTEVAGYRELATNYGQHIDAIAALFPHDFSQYSDGEAWRSPALQIVNLTGLLRANEWARPTVEAAWKAAA
ncbi:MAG: hypothetical protein JWO19_5232 [Bryobacterales bacterium]|nr:hypothetical protein [Bryobacterales bacterium]